MAAQRLYSNKDVEMITTSATIIEHAIMHKAELQPNNKQWADPYFNDLQGQIDILMWKHLRIDSLQRLKETREILTEVEEKSIEDLMEVRIQIVHEYRKDKMRRNEILEMLGFDAYLQLARKSCKESLISLLYKYDARLPEIKDEMIERGVSATYLEAISGYAHALKRANIQQENIHNLKRPVDAAAIPYFNEIYDVVIEICKKATQYCRNNEVRDLFNYKKVMSTVRANRP